MRRTSARDRRSWWFARPEQPEIRVRDRSARRVDQVLEPTPRQRRRAAPNRFERTEYPVPCRHWGGREGGETGEYLTPGERLSRAIVTLTIVAFVGLLLLGLVVYEGLAPVAVSDVQAFMASLDLGGGPPTIVTESLHVTIGFAVAFFTYIAATNVGPRRIRLTARETPARDAAILTVVGVALLAFSLFAGKEFLWDPLYEGQPIQYATTDLFTYALGLVIGFAVGPLLER